MKGYIYKLTSPHTDMIYIGSTSVHLHERYYKHKSKKSSRCASKILFELGDVSIHLIREVEFETQLDLRKLEQIEMDKYDGKLCNDRRAYCCPEIRAEQILKHQMSNRFKMKQKEYIKTDSFKVAQHKYKQGDKYKEYVKHYKYWTRSYGLRAISILKPLFHDI